MAKSLLLRRRDLSFYYGINKVPEREETVDATILDRPVRIEHTDLHYGSSGARLFRVVFTNHTPGVNVLGEAQPKEN